MDKQTVAKGHQDPFLKHPIDQKMANHNLRQYLQSQEQSLRNLTHDLEKKMQLKPTETYPCPVVNYDFSRFLTEVLPRGPKYCCMVCDALFHTRLSMSTHMKIHQKPYCLACFEVFSDEALLHDHILEHHPQIVIPDVHQRGDEHSQATPAPPNTPSYLSEDEAPRNGRFDLMLALPSEEVDPAVLMEHKPQAMTNYSHEFPFQVENDTLLDGELSADAEAFESKADIRQQVKISTAVKKPVCKKPRKRSGKLNQKLGRMVAADQDIDVDHPIVKKVTSRFGRSISIKVAQY